MGIDHFIVHICFETINAQQHKHSKKEKSQKIELKKSLFDMALDFVFSVMTITGYALFSIYTRFRRYPRVQIQSNLYLF